MPEGSREERQGADNTTQELCQEGVAQPENERDIVPVVLIDVPNPEADNAANASAGAQQESILPTTEAMDMDNEGGKNELPYPFSPASFIFLTNIR